VPDTRTKALLCAFALVVLAVAPGRSDAQLIAGVHLAQANDAFAGSFGLGARAGVDVPILPVQVVGVGEYFFPDCGAGDCGLKGASLEANVALPLPILAPYVSLGWAWRELDPVTEDPSVNDSGPTVGLGTRLGLGSLAPFFEARYEFVEAPEEQFLLRFGLQYQR
jgi:hypothetical protein